MAAVVKRKLRDYADADKTQKEYHQAKAAACLGTNSNRYGSRTMESVFENDRVKTLIEEQVPEEVCSWELTNNCDNKFTIGLFSMIELYDGSKHVVKSLQLVRRQMSPGDYTCLGEGESRITAILRGTQLQR